MHLTLPTVQALSDYMVDAPMSNIPLEQLETRLNVVLYILANAKHKTNQVSTGQSLNQNDDINDLLQEFEIQPAEVQFVHTLSDDTLLELSTELKSSNILYKTLKNLLHIPESYPAAAMKSYAILSFLNNFDLSLNELLHESKKQSDDVKSAITMCVERVLQTQGVNYDSAELCLEYLTEIAHPGQPYCLR